MVLTLNIFSVSTILFVFVAKKSKEPVWLQLFSQSFLKNTWPKVLAIASIKDLFSPV